MTKQPTGRNLENIKIQTDDTDHFYFICPDCGVFMKVTESYTKENLRCTVFLLECQLCKGAGVRKNYWDTFHKIENL